LEHQMRVRSLRSLTVPHFVTKQRSRNAAPHTRYGTVTALTPARAPSFLRPVQYGCGHTGCMGRTIRVVAGALVAAVLGLVMPVVHAAPAAAAVPQVNLPQVPVLK